MTVIATLRVCKADNGEQFVMGCYAGNPCGCQIKGAGICNDPLRIEYCPRHKGAGDLLDSLEGLTHLFKQEHRDCADWVHYQRACLAIAAAKE